MVRRSPKSKRINKKPNRMLSPSVIILMVLGAVFLVGAGYLLLPKDDVDPNYIPEVTGGPSIKADKERIDFGDVKFNKPVFASFKLTNVGDKDLQFTGSPYVEVKEGC